jgi:hypothetical protein
MIRGIWGVGVTALMLWHLSSWSASIMRASPAGVMVFPAVLWLI